MDDDTIFNPPFLVLKNETQCGDTVVFACFIVIRFVN